MDGRPDLPDEHDRDLARPGAAGAAVVPEAARISWGAIFAGSVLAGVISMALQLLGIGIGAAMVDPEAESQPMAGLGTGAAIWSVVASLVALFVGGWAAGRLSSARRRIDGVLHGLITWGFVTLAMLFLVTTAIGGVIGSAMGLAPVASEGGADGAQLQRQIERGQRELRERQGEGGRVARPDRDAGERAVSVVGPAAIIAAVALVLGGIVAGLGGAAGVRMGELEPPGPMAPTS